MIDMENHTILTKIRFKTSMLRSDICDYSEAYIVIKGNTTVQSAHDRNKHNRSLNLKNKAPSISCVSKISGTLIENAENLRCCSVYVQFD